MNDETLKRLSQQLGYQFSKIAFLKSAITHRSKGGLHNERLEFLGDSILNFSIASELFNRFPKAREGELTRMRARLVRGETLAEIARDLKLGDFLQLGPGELKSGGHQRDSILADALEAIIGALFLDGGIEICQARILAWYETRLVGIVPENSQKDAKTRLQEYMQSKRMSLPEYLVLGIEGDPHSPIFRVHCRIELLEEPTLGVAANRRKAEQAAAEAALKVLKVE